MKYKVFVPVEATEVWYVEAKDANAAKLAIRQHLYGNKRLDADRQIVSVEKRRVGGWFVHADEN